MLLIMVVSLYTSRIVLNTLGVEDYGIYSIVGGVIVLFSFFHNAMSIATQRFLTYEIGRNDHSKLKHTFSMSINVHLGIGFLILLLGETVGLWFLNTQLKIPFERMVAANWLYQFTIINFLINILKVPYHSTIIAYEKMSFFAYLSIIEAVLKLTIVFLIQITVFDRLVSYGFLLVVVSFLIFISYKTYCNRNYDISHYSFIWDSKLFKSLINFSGWTLFGSSANIGSLQGTNILINIFHGVTVNAAMGIANQVNGTINGFVQNFQTAYQPQIVKSYAIGDKEYLSQLIFQTSKFSFFLLYILALPILFNMEMILELWLKNVPPYAVEFCSLIIFYSLIETISFPMIMTVYASGEIKNYQLITSFIILSNLWISYVFLKLGYEPSIVLLVRIFTNGVLFLYRFWYVRKLISLSIIHYFRKVIRFILLVIGASLVIPIIIIKNNETLIMFFLSLVVTFLSVILSVYFLGLNRKEKHYLRSVIMKMLNRIYNTSER